MSWPVYMCSGDLLSHTGPVFILRCMLAKLSVNFEAGPSAEVSFGWFMETFFGRGVCDGACWPLYITLCGVCGCIRISHARQFFFTTEAYLQSLIYFVTEGPKFLSQQLFVCKLKKRNQHWSLLKSNVDWQGNKLNFLRLMSELFSVSSFGVLTLTSCKCAKFNHQGELRDTSFAL